MTDARRRNLLFLGGIGFAYLALARGPDLVRRLVPPDFSFDDIDGLPGFRRLAGDAPVSGSPILVGLDPDERGPDRAVLARLGADPCAPLFRDALGPGPVSVAYFTDIRCQWCRIMTPLLRARAVGPEATIRLAWHEFPLLGPASVQAARAVLAAERQGAAPAFHARLSGGGLVPTPPILARIATEMGLDASRLLDEMQAPWVETRLAESAALAALFGFPGTPAMVIGRTAVLGRIDERTLDGLIALEAEATGPCA